MNGEPDDSETTKIALAPYGLRITGRLSDVPLSDLKWFDQPTPTSGTIADLGSCDHVLFYIQRSLVLGPHGPVRARLTPLLAEPLELYRRFYLATALTSWRWFRIFTHQAALLRWVPNTRFWPLGNSWVGDPPLDECAKSRRVSLIASGKTTLWGHRLRHEIAAWVKSTEVDVDLLGLAYRPFKHKIEGLAPYRFSVVIENARDRGYFTEKLIDALLCRTVPIYWGAPDIERFFDVKGMLICTTADELKAAIMSADAGTYARMREAIENNHFSARAYLDQDRNAVDLMRAELFGPPPLAESRSQR